MWKTSSFNFRSVIKFGEKERETEKGSSYMYIKKIIKHRLHVLILAI